MQRLESLEFMKVSYKSAKRILYGTGKTLWARVRGSEERVCSKKLKNNTYSPSELFGYRFSKGTTSGLCVM
jgi:hypothetical protein